MTATNPDGTPKYARAASLVRALIASGTLRPGDPVPSGTELARATGYHPLTCRRALRMLVSDGTLAPGAGPGARHRVPAPPEASTGRDAARDLSAALSARRRAAGLTQPQLAALAGYSTTTIGHAETGRLWQSRKFWEDTDKALGAGGELTALHDVHRARRAAPATTPVPGGLHGARTVHGECPDECPTPADIAPAAVIITWPDGTATTVYPPAAPP